MLRLPEVLRRVRNRAGWWLYFERLFARRRRTLRYRPRTSSLSAMIQPLETRVMLSGVNAQDDAATIEVNLPVVVDILANDSDPDSDSFEVINISTPSHGTAELRPDVPGYLWDNWLGGGQSNYSSFEDWYTAYYTYEYYGYTNFYGPLNGAPLTYKLHYTPTANYFGTDSLTYTIEDETGAQDTATVNITINTPPAPTPQNDTLTLLAGQTVDINVLSNDTDPAGRALTLISVSTPAQGAASIATLSNGQKVVRYVAGESYTGIETLTYTLQNSAGVSASATITLTINENTNHAPTAINDAATTDINTPVLIDVLANDSDVDGDAFSITNISTPSHGTAELRPDVPSYLWDNWTNYWQGYYSSFEEWYGAQYSYEYNGQTYFWGPLYGEPIVYKINYTPNVDYYGTDSFTYSVTDESGVQASAAVNIVVYPPWDQDQNDQINESNLITLPTVISGQLGVGDVNMYRIEVANGQVITFDLDRLSGNLDSLLTIFTATGELLIANDNAAGSGETLSTDSFLQYEFGEAGTYYIAISGATNLHFDPLTGEGDLASEAGTYHLAIETIVPNLPPIAIDDIIFTEPGQPVDFNVLGNDSDLNADIFTIVQVGLPANGVVELLDESIETPPEGFSEQWLRYTPGHNFAGTDTFTYQIQDSSGELAVATVVINVATNEPPVTVDDQFVYAVDSIGRFDVLANDNDPEGGPLQIVATSENLSVRIVYDEALGRDLLEYVGQPGVFGTQLIDYTIEDNDGNQSTGHATVDVSLLKSVELLGDDGIGNVSELVALVHVGGIIGGGEIRIEFDSNADQITDQTTTVTVIDQFDSSFLTQEFSGLTAGTHSIAVRTAVIDSATNSTTYSAWQTTSINLIAKVSSEVINFSQATSLEPATDSSPEKVHQIVSGEVTGGSQGRSYQAVQIDLNDDGIGEAIVYTNELGRFDFEPLGLNAATSNISARGVIVDENGEVTHWGSWVTTTFNPPSLAAAGFDEIHLATEADTPTPTWTTFQPSISGTLSNTSSGASHFGDPAGYSYTGYYENITAEFNLSNVFVEFDLDQNGTVDGTTVSKEEGQFNFYAANLLEGFHTVNLRTVRFDENSHQKYISEWSTFSFTLLESTSLATSITSFGLQTDDGVSSSDQLTTTPMLKGTVDTAGLPSGLILEFAHTSGSNEVQGTSSVADDGTFLYLPIGISNGINTIRVRSKYWDASGRTNVISDWYDFTFTLLDEDVSQPVIFQSEEDAIETNDPPEPVLDDSEDQFSAEYNSSITNAYQQQLSALSQSLIEYESQISSSSSDLEASIISFDTQFESALAVFSGETSTNDFEEFKWDSIPVIVDFPEPALPLLPVLTSSTASNGNGDVTHPVFNSQLKLNQDQAYLSSTSTTQSSYSEQLSDAYNSYSTQIKSLEAANENTVNRAAYALENAKKQAQAILDKSASGSDDAALIAKIAQIESRYQQKVDPLNLRLSELSSVSPQNYGEGLNQLKDVQLDSIQQAFDNYYEDWLYYGYYGYGSGEYSTHPFLQSIIDAEVTFYKAKNEIDSNDRVEFATAENSRLSEIEEVSRQISLARHEADFELAKARIEFQQQLENTQFSAQQLADTIKNNAGEAYAKTLADARKTFALGALGAAQTLQDQIRSLSSSLNSEIISAARDAFAAWSSANPSPYADILNEIFEAEIEQIERHQTASDQLMQEQSQTYAAALTKVINADNDEAKGAASAAKALSEASNQEYTAYSKGTISSHATQLLTHAQERKVYLDAFTSAQTDLDLGLLANDLSYTIAYEQYLLTLRNDETDLSSELWAPFGNYFIVSSTDPTLYGEFEFSLFEHGEDQPEYVAAVAALNQTFQASHSQAQQAKKDSDRDARQTWSSDRLEIASTFYTSKAATDQSFTNETVSLSHSLQNSILSAEVDFATTSTQIKKTAVLEGLDAGLAYRTEINESNSQFQIETSNIDLETKLKKLSAAYELAVAQANENKDKIDAWAEPESGQISTAYKSYQKRLAEIQVDRLTFQAPDFTAASPEYTPRFKQLVNGNSSPELNRLVEQVAQQQADLEDRINEQQASTQSALDDLESRALESLDASSEYANSMISAQAQHRSEVLNAQLALQQSQSQATVSNSISNTDALFNMLSSIDSAYWSHIYEKTPPNHSAFSQSAINAKLSYISAATSAKQAQVSSNIQSAQAFQTAIQSANMTFADNSLLASQTEHTAKSAAINNASSSALTRLGNLQAAGLSRTQLNQQNSLTLSTEYANSVRQADDAYHSALDEARKDYQIAAAQEKYDRVLNWKNSLSPGSMVDGIEITPELAQYYLDVAAADLAWATTTASARPGYYEQVRTANSTYATEKNAADHSTFSSQQTAYANYQTASHQNDMAQQSALLAASQDYQNQTFNATALRKHDESIANGEHVYQLGEDARNHLTAAFSDYTTNTNDLYNAHFGAVGNSQGYSNDPNWQSTINPMIDARQFVLIGYSKNHSIAIGETQSAFVTTLGGQALDFANEINDASTAYINNVANLPELADSVTTTYATDTNSIEAQRTLAYATAEQARLASQNSSWINYSSLLSQATAERRIAYAEAFVDYQLAKQSRFTLDAQTQAASTQSLSDLQAATIEEVKEVWTSAMADAYLDRQTADALAWKAFSDQIDLALSVRMSADQVSQAAYQSTQANLSGTYNLASVNAGLAFDQETKTAQNTFLTSTTTRDNLRRINDVEDQQQSLLDQAIIETTYFSSQFLQPGESGSVSESDYQVQMGLRQLASQAQAKQSQRDWAIESATNSANHEKSAAQINYDYDLTLADAEELYASSLASAQVVQAQEDLAHELAYRQAIQAASLTLSNALSQSTATFRTATVSADLAG